MTDHTPSLRDFSNVLTRSLGAKHSVRMAYLPALCEYVAMATTDTVEISGRGKRPGEALHRLYLVALGR